MLAGYHAHMTLRGTIYKRIDGLIESRIIAPKQRRADRRIVGTSGGQGFDRKRPALVTLDHLLLTGPHVVFDVDGNEVPPTKAQVAAYKGKNRPKLKKGVRRPRHPYIGRVVRSEATGKFEWQIKSRNGNLVFSSHSQGFERAGKVRPDGTPTPGTALDSLVAICHGGPHEVDPELAATAPE